jgi:hypothetical protein
MPQRTSFVGRLSIALGLLVCVVSLTGCLHPQAQRLFPDRIDFVATVAPISGAGPATATLKAGETISLDPTKTLVLGAPKPGDLLIRGSQPRPWLLTVSSDPSRGCRWFVGWGTEDGASIALDAGPVLPKAANFDRGAMGPDQHRFEESGFCLDDKGQVTDVEL